MAIVFGVIECFLGYRIFKAIPGIIGLPNGTTITITTGNMFSQNELILFVMGFIGGFVGAVMMIWLYFFGVFVIA
jgi:hypothetical protein